MVVIRRQLRVATLMPRGRARVRYRGLSGQYGIAMQSGHKGAVSTGTIVMRAAIGMANDRISRYRRFRPDRSPLSATNRRCHIGK